MKTPDDVYLAAAQIVGRGEHACRDAEVYREAAALLRRLLAGWWKQEQERESAKGEAA